MSRRKNLVAGLAVMFALAGAGHAGEERGSCTYKAKKAADCHWVDGEWKCELKDETVELCTTIRSKEWCDGVDGTWDAGGTCPGAN